MLDKNIKIAVLMGGLSDEREVSFETGRNVVKSLKDGGYLNVFEIDMGRDVAEVLKNITPDVVFNALHGNYGEDGDIQGVLEILGIPYTGSKVTASALGMDKVLTKTIMQAIGIPVASGIIFNMENGIDETVKYPFFLKDAVNGSSCGVWKIKSESELENIRKKLDSHKRYIAENCFVGREIQVAVLNGKVIGDVEIVPAGEFYDYEAKYLSDKTKYIIDPVYNEEIKEKLFEDSEKLYSFMGCKGAVRIDYMVNDTSYIALEINTLPGMTSHSLLPMICKGKGISYLRLVEMLIEEALSI